MTLSFDPEWDWLDLAKLAPALRKVDVMECEAWGLTPLEALHSCFASSDPGSAWLVRGIDGEIVGACGASKSPTTPGTAEPWLIGADALNVKYRREFLRDLPAKLAKVQSTTPILAGLMDARNVLHRRWCERLGFVFHAPVAAGPYGLPFLPFIKERTD